VACINNKLPTKEDLANAGSSFFFVKVVWKSAALADLAQQKVKKALGCRCEGDKNILDFPDF
jgi:hypothetical protein